MSRLGLSREESTILCSWLLLSVDSACLADWEFESLVGSSRSQARQWIEAGLPEAEHDEQLLDRVVTMLSVLAGSLDTRGAPREGPSLIAPGAIAQMLEKLFWSSEDVRAGRAALQSSVTLRPRIQPELAAPTVRKAARRRRVSCR